MLFLSGCRQKVYSICDPMPKLKTSPGWVSHHPLGIVVHATALLLVSEVLSFDCVHCGSLA